MSVVRFGRSSDVDALIEREEEKWDGDQAAGRAELAARIEAYPRLSIGAFDPSSGRDLASLFMKPITSAELESAATWADCARVEKAVPAAGGSLFGNQSEQCRRGRGDGHFRVLLAVCAQARVA
ncbi:hypothetical protein [Streptomyces capitiformicae]|uniref:Uncharacterized protein n=1 Tax=Streptomyces capitiformicae TaxID=2014920 RepID=A0A919GBP0_9ACTN|nr:hypothetical protein [Streptomyces capitiformicae]GHH81561.1 hypothetical protein GCM10017771_03780 [Streptomyces capitiformicae]